MQLIGCRMLCSMSRIIVAECFDEFVAVSFRSYRRAKDTE